MWVFMRDIRREHKTMVKSFDKDPRADATLAMCTCLPGAKEEWAGMEHAVGCRTWLT